MNRREFLRRAALVAAGVVAADQLELLERLAHRKVFALGAPESIAYVYRGVRTPLPPLVWRRLNEGVYPRHPYMPTKRDFLIT